LPLCILDATFGINTNYGQVQNVIARYCKYYRIQKIREPRTELPPRTAQISVSTFVGQIERLGPATFASSVVSNNGKVRNVLKAEIALQFARTVKGHGIETLQDMQNSLADRRLEADLRDIYGIGAGALGNFMALSGSDDRVHPSRHLIKFCEEATSTDLSADATVDLMHQAWDDLRSSYPGITLRMVDYEIWRTRNG
jgi:hypothetical protein